MKKSAMLFDGIDGNKIYVYKWLPDGGVKGVIQIFHGMAEHAARYERLAEYMTQKGYALYANDHRGHGKSLLTSGVPGDLGDDGFSKMVEEEKRLSELIKKENSGKKLFVLGHSMGSFVAQEYILRYSDKIDGVILSGTAGARGNELILGKLLAKLELIVRGRNKPSRMLDFLNFGNHNRGFGKNCQKFAWLSRDGAEVDKYEKDPLCGIIFPANFYECLYTGYMKLHIDKRVASIRKNLPVFIFAGDCDPVGLYGRLVKKLFVMYKKHNIDDVKLKLYNGGRHEMLNETNRAEVFEDIALFIDSRI